MKLAPIAVVVAMLAAPQSGAQPLFKCVGADGKTSYQSEPCPVAATEKKLDVRTGPMSTGGSEAIPGAAPGTPGGMKPGGDQREIIFMADTCSRGVLEPAAKDFDAQNLPLPPALKPDVDNFCNCTAKKASMSYTFLEYTRNPLAIVSQLQQDALKGGECEPRGAYADLLRKAG